jgi:hypothetical protein
MSRGPYKFLFEPLTGQFELRPAGLGPGLGGGTTVTAGVLQLPSGTQMECLIELRVTSAGSILIDSGSTILVN